MEKNSPEFLAIAPVDATALRVDAEVVAKVRRAMVPITGYVSDLTMVDLTELSRGDVRLAFEAMELAGEVDVSRGQFDAQEWLIRHRAEKQRSE